jgi:hypothetical protein
MLASPDIIDRSTTNYWAGVSGKDCVHIKREKDIYHHGPRPEPI